MTFQTVSGAAHPSGTFHLCDRTEPPRTDEAQWIERFEHFTLPLCVPAVFSRFLLRRGIGGSVLDRSTNATRDFSDSSEAFRAGTDCSVLMWRLRSSSSHFRLVTATLISPFGPCSERLSTLPGQVAPGHLTAWGALPFPTLGRSISTKGGATNSPHTSEIAAGRSIGPSRRLESGTEVYFGGNHQELQTSSVSAPTAKPRRCQCHRQHGEEKTNVTL